ncbi:MAG: sigma 54-interacting transcriptional regulator [Verrucomicrobiota bacterium JB022]|nr:sigma 54-interacting transcriptional regulator [Verrucomicrobiota bacterium JB022]
MPAALLSSEDRAFAEAISQLTYCDPFAPQRVELERQALGAEYTPPPRAWNLDPMAPREEANLQRMLERVREIEKQAGPGYRDGKGGKRDRHCFEDMVVFELFHRYQYLFDEYIHQAHQEGTASSRLVFYRDFLARYQQTLGPEQPIAPAHLFALFFQIRRAFFHIFRFFVGGSAAAMRLRSSVWQSIFTHSLDRYQRVLYPRMSEIPTLITGPSGTGKELVARAIGLSQYLPFEPETLRFAEDFVQVFQPINLSALSPTLIESELFGHRKGAFTGALQDRTGYFEACGPYGSVFLDEIGETDHSIQVKLLRVLQTRQFQRLGDTGLRRFQGKVIAATNRNLQEEIANGTFREDFYYRLRADVITTPSLQEILAGQPAELEYLVRFVATRVTGEADAEDLTADVLAWARQHPNYPWPGNFRELEQAVRNILLRREYRPDPRPRKSTGGDWREALGEIDWTTDRLLSEYITRSYARYGNYEETARRLGLDRRTVKKYLDESLLPEK